MNRFLQAKTLNNGDELAWYLTYKGRPLKCLWRAYSHEELVSSDKVQLTFLAQWMDTQKVYVVFTADYNKQKEGYQNVSYDDSWCAIGCLYCACVFYIAGR